MRQTNGFSYKNYSLFLPLILCCIIFIVGCNTGKRVAYFRNVPDSLTQPYAIQNIAFVQPKIQPTDILNISIQTIDPRSVDMITGSNAANGSSGINPASGTPSTGANTSGFLVDADGYVDVPLVGRAKVGGLTTTEARKLIYDKAALYYKDPVVNVRFGNFTITILGDVNRPGTYTVPNEKVSILDAIGLAGDLAPSGRRENILLLREESGDSVIAARLSLNSTDIFNSPYYFLRTHDKLYIQPNKAKAKSATVDYTKDRYFTYIVSFLTLFIAISAKYGF